MFLEISKKAVKKYGSIEKAITEGYFGTWDADRIKKAFNFGRGSITDFFRHVESNAAFCYYIEVKQ